jgi:Protein of unknown function, DUF481
MRARGRPAPPDRMTGKAGLSACLMLCLLALPAWAQKTDIVTLVNGDTLTGEIKLLERGRLQVSTDHLGTVNIEWDKVISVTALRMFQIETSNGVRLLGQLTTTAPGQFEVIAAEGTFPVDRETVVYIAPIARGFWRRLDGSVDFGLSYTQSSGVAQLNLSASATYRQPNFQLTGSATSYYTRQRDVEDTSRSAVDFRGVRPFGEYYMWLAQGAVERNEALGYDVRATVGGAVGRFLVRSNRAVLGVGAGLSTSRELPTDGDSVQFLDALFSVRQSFFTYDSPKTDISMSLDVFPGLTQWGRLRAQFDGEFRREIVHDFTVGFTIYDSYDNRPPSADASKNDVGLSLTIGWTF